MMRRMSVTLRSLRTVLDVETAGRRSAHRCATHVVSSSRSPVSAASPVEVCEQVEQPARRPIRSASSPSTVVLTSPPTRARSTRSATSSGIAGASSTSTAATRQMAFLVGAPHCHGLVRLPQLRLDCVGERCRAPVGDVVVDDERAVLERDEAERVAAQVGCVRRGDDVPRASRLLDAREAGKAEAGRRRTPTPSP